MKKLSIFFFLFILLGCQNYGQLRVVTNLPKLLDEVSGIQKEANSDKVWMVNDSGNKSELYKVTSEGKIEKTISINAKNYDWEDLTSDDKENLYIADFGNNDNKRKNLVILKIKKEDLLNGGNIEVEKIQFSYPNQTKFPPQKKDRFFDAESLICKDGFLYIFTKSRVKDQYGKTTLYKVPATKGEHIATYISDYTNCSDAHCVITASAISPDKKKVALLTHQSVLIFTNFKGDDFFSGDVKEYIFNHISQKEGVDFKDDTILYITDEASKMKNAMLYELSLNE